MKKAISISVISVLMLIANLGYASGDGTKLIRLGLMNIHTNDEAYDAIIVPGFPCDGEKWSLTVKMRLVWAKYLYDNGFANNIIVSGSSVYTKYNEAEVMAIYAEAMGIPCENIYTETTAEHSTENVFYSMKLAHALNFEKIAVATDPFQMTFLLRKFMKKESLAVDKLPIHFGILSKLDQTEPEVDLTSSANPNFVSLIEREGRAERKRGTKGLHIKR